MPRQIILWIVPAIACLTQFGHLALANDTCREAVLMDSNSFPQIIQGDTTGSTVDFATPADTVGGLTCGIRPDGPGIWYSVTGRDEFLRATLTDVSTTNDIKFTTALFRLPDGMSTCQQASDLQCLLFGDYALDKPRTEPTSTWFAEKDVTYYLHVAGTGPTEVGPFDLSFETLTYDRPQNDQCSQAETSSLPLEKMGISNIGSHPIGVMNDECLTRPSARGLFYRFKIEQEGLDIFLRNIIPHEADKSVDLEIALLQHVEGDCSNKCIAVWDLLQHTETEHLLEISGDMVMGEAYTLLVSGGQFDDAATFDLHVRGVGMHMDVDTDVGADNSKRSSALTMSTATALVSAIAMVALNLLS